MANDCSGVLRVVSKNRETLDRIFKILNYEDDEYCLYRCRYVNKFGDTYEEDGLYVQDFAVSGAWSCSPFFDYGEHTEMRLIAGYEKNEDGTTDFNKPIKGSAHFTDLCHLAKVLDFGCELFASEGGVGFCQHCIVNHEGEYDYEEDNYSEIYPEDEDGEPIYDEEPEEDYGSMDFMKFSSVEEIYGE